MHRQHTPARPSRFGRATTLTPRRPRPRRVARGFTLIEAALTTVIVGTGVLSIMAAQQAYLRKNDWAQRAGTALLLANELRELTLSMPLYDPITGTTTVGPEAGEAAVDDYDDLDDFAGVVAGGFGAGLTFDPPINALRQVIPNMNGWSQRITVENVLPGFVSATFTQPLGTTDMVRATVAVRYQGPNDPNTQTITQLRWLVAQ